MTVILAPLNNEPHWNTLSCSQHLHLQIIYINTSIYIFTTIWIVRCTLGVVISSITPKPYILQKILFQWICCKYLAWLHGHNHFWPPRLWRLLEAKNIISRRTLWHFNSMFGSSHSASSAYQRFTKKLDQLWLSASISRILDPSPQGRAWFLVI